MPQTTESNPFETAARLAKRDRILLALRAPFRHAIHAAVAAGLREPTYEDLARVLEQGTRLHAEGEKFSLRFRNEMTERASQKTWALVIAVLREWAASDVRGAERAV